MIKMYMDNVIMILRKRKGLFIGVILLICVIFTAVGGISSQIQSAKETSKTIEEKYGEQKSYFTRESMNDVTYYQYLEDEKKMKNMEKFLSLIRNSNQIMFYTQIEHQGIQVIDDVLPNEFLMGYEIGEYDCSVCQYEGDTLYTTKAVYVSEGFFEEYGIRLSDGRSFDKTDYIYHTNSDIPVLLGSNYQDIYKLGDRFCGYTYLDGKVMFEVVGFLDAENYFYSCQNKDFVSLNRYMIVPALDFTEFSEAASIMLLQETTGIVLSHYEYEKTEEILQNYLKKAGLEHYDIHVQNPDIEQVMSESVGVYKSMTKEIEILFCYVLGIMLLLSLIAISMVVCNCVRENIYAYGVLMLSGASNRNIYTEVVLFLTILFLSGDIMATGMTVILGSRSILLMQVLALLFIFLCSVISIIYISRMDMSEIIGGKE